MNNITITTWGHSAVRLERDGALLVIDPGTLSDQMVIESASAILITHEHADHYSPDLVVNALAKNDELEVWAPQSVVDQLTEAGAPNGSMHIVTLGDEFSAAGFRIRALGGKHAVVHQSIPVIANISYLIEGKILHPGDAFTPPPESIKLTVLFLPVSAPWLKVAETIDYVRQLRPEIAIPIHDAILSDAGRAIVDRLVGGHAGDTRYQRLTSTNALSV